MSSASIILLRAVLPAAVSSEILVAVKAFQNYWWNGIISEFLA